MLSLAVFVNIGGSSISVIFRDLLSIFDPIDSSNSGGFPIVLFFIDLLSMFEFFDSSGSGGSPILIRFRGCLLMFDRFVSSLSSLNKKSFESTNSLSAIERDDFCFFGTGESSNANAIYMKPMKSAMINYKRLKYLRFGWCHFCCHFSSRATLFCQIRYSLRS